MTDTPRPFPASYWLFGATLVLFLALLILPMTHWMAATQSKMLLVSPGEYVILMKDLGVRESTFDGDPTAAERARKAAIEHNANDYQIQLAAASAASLPPGLSGEANSTARLAPLRALKARFPEHQAAISAHILRYATMYLGTHRDDEVETYNTGKPSTTNLPSPYTPPSDAYLAAYDADAAEGERLEPDNAFFPLMRSVGLFAAKRDEVGIAALLRAGQKPHLNDYTAEGARANWKLYETALGKQSATIRACVYSAVLFPHYARIRSVARFAVYKAAKAEESGHTAEGVAIRHAMMHCAHLLRTDSQSSIGSLVGMACAAITTTRPGGVLTSYDKVPAEQRPALRRDAYTAYLRKIGQASEADGSQKELDAAPKTKALLEAGMKQSVFGESQINGLFDQWTLDMVLLANALELLILGGAMLLLTKLRRDTGSLPICVAMILCVAFFALALATRWPEGFVTFRTIFKNLNSNSSDDLAGPLPDPFHYSAPVVKASVIGLSLFGPLLSLVVLGFLRLARPKESPSVVAPGLRTGGLAVALGLMAIYGAALYVTSQKEASANNALDRIEQSEPRYLAELQGKSWPP